VVRFSSGLLQKRSVPIVEEIDSRDCPMCQYIVSAPSWQESISAYALERNVSEDVVRKEVMDYHHVNRICQQFASMVNS